jgi:dTDP-4-amino-4,6-dideoxygalactose transaminase
MTIANEYGICKLEDAAEALGSAYRGRKCGTFGEFACLSFNGNKMITTSGGGALVCRTAEEAERTKFFARRHGIRRRITSIRILGTITA